MIKIAQKHAKKYAENFSEYQQQAFDHSENPEILNPSFICQFQEERKKGELADKLKKGEKSFFWKPFKYFSELKNFDGFSNFVDWASFGFVSKISKGVVNPIYGDQEINHGSGTISVSEIYKDQDDLLILQNKLKDKNLTSHERLLVEQEFVKKKAEISSKYSSHSTTGFVASQFGSGFKNGDFRLDNSGLFNEYALKVKESFYKGKNLIRSYSCDGGYLPEFNIFIYMFLALLSFYFFKILK